jgi:hypothetical protein
MVILLRRFRSGAGAERAGMEAVRTSAIRMVRGQQAEAVLLCQRSDAPSEILWLEHRGRGAGSTRVSHTPLAAAAGQLLEETTPPQQVELLDGFYRFPLPPCRVWLLEAPEGAEPEPEVVRALLDLSRLGAKDPRVAGLSVYRVVGEPAPVIAFLALAPDLTPGEYLFTVRRPDAAALDEALSSNPLSASWTVGRLSADPSGTATPTRYPRAAFWARAGSMTTMPVVLPSTTTSERMDGAGHIRTT